MLSGDENVLDRRVCWKHNVFMNIVSSSASPNAWRPGVVAMTILIAISLPQVSAELSREPHFLVRSWDTRHGIPNAPVVGIQRSPDGYLWVATKRGIARFDGVRFVVYDESHIPEFKGRSVTALLVDGSGAIWIGTDNGLIYVAGDRIDLSVRSVKQEGARVLALGEDPEGTVWAAIRQTGLVGFPSGGGTSLFWSAQLNESKTQFLGGDKRSLLLASGDRLWSRKDNTWEEISADVGVSSSWTALGRGRDDTLWMAVDGPSVFQLPAGQELFAPPGNAKSLSRVPGSVSALMEDHHGRVWAGTLGGDVFCFTHDPGWQRITPLRGYPLGGALVIYQSEDDDVVWVGTGAGGIYQIRPRAVMAWPLPVAAWDAVPHAVWPAHDGSIWIGTDTEGVFRLNRGEFIRYGAAHGLRSETVMTILEDRNERIWLGTMKGPYFWTGDRFEPLEVRDLKGFTVSAIYEDRAGDIWFGATKSLVRYRDGKAYYYKMLEPPPESVDLYEIRAIAEDREGVIWVGTRRGGLFQLDTGTLIQRKDFPGLAVSAISADPQGGVWIGTVDAGLFYVNGERIVNWRKSDGLPDQSIYSILQDDHDRIWMTSNEGIYALHRGDLLAYTPDGGRPLLPLHLFAEDGMLDHACIASGQPSGAKDALGRLWFPTVEGIAAITPDALMSKPRPLKVRIEDIVVDGRIISLVGHDSVVVPPAGNRHEFHFTCPTLDVTARVLFRYRLVGFDDQWSVPSNQRQAVYGRLLPGTYRFEVLAGVDHQWYPADAITFHVEPLFWERRSSRMSALALSFAVVIVTVNTMVRAREKKKRRKLELQRAMEMQRSRIARDLHDDIGSGLTELMILGDLAQRESAPSEEASRYIRNITGKTRQLASALDQAVWMINPKNDQLANFAGYVADYARELLQAAGWRCRIHVTDDLPVVPLTATQRHHLFLAVKECVNNALCHSGGSEVHLHIDYHQEELVIRIVDDGRGFDAGMTRPEGNGLVNMESRLGELGGALHVESAPGKGTSIKMTLAIGGRKSGSGEK